MCYQVLNEQVDLISRSTVKNVTKEGVLNQTQKETLELADKKIKEKLADENHELDKFPENKLFHEDILFDEGKERYFDTEVPEAGDYTEEGPESIIGANVKLQHNSQTVKAKITKQDIGPDEKPIGKYNQNPIFDSRKYEVELPDGVVYEYYHNILSDKLCSQFDEEGREFILMKEISDHKIEKSSIREWRKGLITTKRWKLVSEWKDGAQYWITIKDIKKYNPAETALITYLKNRPLSGGLTKC